nr:hypothetical protein Itr_chr08CG01210 [Ipomoea trifida]GMD23028.1 hypothetical protein Iba_chr08bCG1330 [Ipomoea batatas]
MAKYNYFTAIMSLQLVALATLIACATAAMEEQAAPSSSKYAKWAENNKVKEYMKLSSSAAEEKHNIESCPAPSSASSENEEKPKWTAEEMENMNDNQLKEVAASLMAEKDAPPKHKCWQKCAFDKLRPYCEHLVVQSTIPGCLLAGGKACALYCTGGSLK